jgi:hypothetical protein
VANSAHSELAAQSLFGASYGALAPLLPEQNQGISGGSKQLPEAGDANIVVAHHLSEHNESAQFLGHEILEIAEAIVLALVAIIKRPGPREKRN